MSEQYPLIRRSRIGQQWAARINSLGQLRDRIVGAIERAAQRAFGNDGSLVPIPVRAVAGRRRDQRRSHD